VPSRQARQSARPLLSLVSLPRNIEAELTQELLTGCGEPHGPVLYLNVPTLLERLITPSREIVAV
jgi:hypothetical protein